MHRIRNVSGFSKLVGVKLDKLYEDGFENKLHELVHSKYKDQKADT
jgi:hypothetical protein